MFDTSTRAADVSERRRLIIGASVVELRAELAAVERANPARARAAAELMRALSRPDIRMLAIARASYRSDSYAFRVAFARLRQFLTVAEDRLAACDDGDRRGAAASSRSRSGLLIENADAESLPTVAESVADELDRAHESRAVVGAISDQLGKRAWALNVAGDARIRSVLARLNAQTLAVELAELREVYATGERILAAAAELLRGDDRLLDAALDALRAASDREDATVAGG